MFISKNTKTDVSFMRLGYEPSSTALQGSSHQRSVGLRDICLILSSTTSFIDRGSGYYWCWLLLGSDRVVSVLALVIIGKIKIHPGYYSKIISSVL